MATYESLGVNRVVNAAGNSSALGSACMSPEVLQAMCEAAKWYVDMDELHQRCGEYIARITGAEAGLVTSGAAGGLLLATAACITGGDRGMMLDLPEAAQGAEVIIQKGHRIGFDQAVRTAGASLVEVGLPYHVHPEQIERAINERTVAILFVFGEVVSRRGEVSLETVVEIGKRHEVPVIVDASVVNYPIERLREYVALGVDLVVTSGGKHIFGPPGTGFLCGRRDLVEACRLQAGPAYGIGRPMKLGKEEMVGLITALETYVSRDAEAEHREWESKARFLVERLGELPYVEVTPTFSDEVERPVPRVRLWVDEAALGVTAFEVAARLRQGEPPVWVHEFDLHEGVLILNPVCLLEGDEQLIVQAWQNIWRSLIV